MRSNSEIANLIKQKRISKGISLSELARRVGVSKSTLSRYENKEREIPINDIGKYASVLDLSVSELLGFKVIAQSNMVKIPILGQISCGNPITAEENVIGYLQEPADTLPSGNIFALSTVGNSMSPTIPEGSSVIIREQPDVEQGEIAAVLVNGDSEATLKRVKRQGDIVMLIADNPEYPPYIVTEDNPARILGKAIKFTANL